LVNTPESNDWPPAKHGRTGAEKTLYEAKVDLHKQQEINKFTAGRNLDAQIARDKATFDAENAEKKADADAKLALDKAFVEAVFEVAKGAIDRARSGAESVRSAAAAIMVIYTGVLGVAFSVTDRPLPPRGFLAAFFLGLAIVLSTFYLAYQSKRDDKVDVPKFGEDDDPYAVGQKLSRAFVLWNRSGASGGRYPLRASVAALAVAIFFLPAPFITFSGNEVSGSAPPSGIHWPKLPKLKHGTDATLANTLYTAKVSERADRRKAEIQASKVVTTGRDWAWIGAGLGGLLAVGLLPLIIGGLVDRDQYTTPNDKLPTPMAEE
jgi:hypothetical protein